MTTFDHFWKLTNSTGIAGGNDTADNFGVEHPKLKFNFTVQFVPRNVALPEQGNTEMAAMAFALKTASRPKPTITYQDVNFYNYRTKVATNMDYGQMSLSFYDDPKNKAHDIVTSYLSTVSPIFGRSQTEADNFDKSGQGNAASIGALSGNRHGPMKAIIVTHHYYHANKAKRVTYEYLNPKLLSAELDDLDMSLSEASLVTINFVYDTFKVTKA